MAIESLALLLFIAGITTRVPAVGDHVAAASDMATCLLGVGPRPSKDGVTDVSRIRGTERKQEDTSGHEAVAFGYGGTRADTAGHERTRHTAGSGP